MKLGELARQLGADLTLNGAVERSQVEQTEITGVAAIEAAGPNEISFVANPKYAALARATRAAALIVPSDFHTSECPLFRVQNPKLVFTRALEIFHPKAHWTAGIHPTAVIASSAIIGQRAHLGAYVVIGDNCILGNDCVLLPHVVLYPGVHIGDRLLAHAHAVVRENCCLGNDIVLGNGAVIGSDGFGFAKNEIGAWIKVAQAGAAVLENDVEVQANACIDRASVGETRIGEGAKIDNLVQVGHESRVGPRTLLCAQVGLAGSTTVGRDVILAGQVGVAGHLTVGDGAVATAQTGIPSDVAPGAVVSGYPAMDNRAWLRTVAAVNRLPELVRTLKAARPSAESAPPPAEKLPSPAATDILAKDEVE